MRYEQEIVNEITNNGKLGQARAVGEVDFPLFRMLIIKPFILLSVKIWMPNQRTSSSTCQFGFRSMN